MGSYRGGAPPGDPQPATRLFGGRGAGGEEGPHGGTGRGNLRTLCPGQPLGTVPRKRCSGQVLSRTAGLGGAFTRDSRPPPRSSRWIPTTDFKAMTPHSPILSLGKGEAAHPMAGKRGRPPQSLTRRRTPTGGWAEWGTPSATRGPCPVPCSGARRRPSRRPAQPSNDIPWVGRPERVDAAGKAPRFAERPSVAEPEPWRGLVPSHEP
jgi:hypothetical protein